MINRVLLVAILVVLIVMAWNQGVVQRLLLPYYCAITIGNECLLTNNNVKDLDSTLSSFFGEPTPTPEPRHCTFWLDSSKSGPGVQGIFDRTDTCIF